MQNITMFYKYPGSHELQDGRYDYMLVDFDDVGAVSAAKAEGWYVTAEEAKANPRKIDTATEKAFEHSLVDDRTVEQLASEIKEHNATLKKPRKTDKPTAVEQEAQNGVD